MNILIFAGLFWFFTYAALSVRTELILGDQFNLFTVRRILGTTVGALAFGLVLTCIARRARDGILNPASAIAAILPASLLVLAARLAIDELFYELPLPFETNFKWVAVWAELMWLSSSGSSIRLSICRVKCCSTPGCTSAVISYLCGVESESAWPAYASSTQTRLRQRTPLSTSVTR